MQDEELSPAAKLVFSVISSYVGTEEKNISYETISKKTSLTTMTIIRAVRALEDNGFLEVTKSTRGWNLYRVISEEESMLADHLEYISLLEWIMTLTEVIEQMKDGYNITEFITVREGHKEYNIDRVYLEDFSDGFYQIVIEIEEDKWQKKSK